MPPIPEKPDEIGNAGRPAAQTPHSGAAVATLEPQAMHAIVLLKSDHRAAEALFGSIRNAEEDALRADLAERLAQSLDVHMQVEEEIFYPAIERAGGFGHDVRHARREHAEIRERIARMLNITSDGNGDRAANAAVDALEAAVTHHVEEEETELFPKLEAVDLDWTALGIAIAELRTRLLRGV
jgi:hemerythrin-like domain-containing protein